MSDSATLIIGVGNSDRGDDACGILTARRLRQSAGSEIRVLECSGEATQLIEAFDGANTVFIIDAAELGAAAGTVKRFDASVQTLPETLSDCSSHSFGVAQGIELARALNCLPQCCVLYAVQGAGYAAGQTLSAAVQTAILEVEQRIMQELDNA